MTKTMTVAEMALREVSRRRGVLAILLVFPLAFYLSRRDLTGQSIRFVCLGVGWAMSTAALFAGSAARSLEPRLRLSGYRGHHLYLGRLLALWTLGLALALPYFVLIRVDAQHVRYGAIALIMLLTVAVAAPFGLALSSALPRELEGMLVLLTVVGLQMMMDPADSASRVLPFWFSREIGTYAVDHADSGYLHRGLLHGLLFLVVLLTVVAASSAVRLRRRPHLRFVR
ncbi:ABC transporter permease [Catellatospora tritici]|uniref:ABC transporter permease n=1 Tax=Catellatospora tritici TaxID=2851566 RepID=UPI001C2DA086|nr:ABC transporter permease [Catellatospora tritici]MBV1848699.1 ABC transporter permease [Catellatospora tritici]